MPFVLDASVAVAWHLEDESSEYSERILQRLDVDEARVPSIWPMELANVLLVAERRGRLLHEKVVAALELSRALPIVVRETPVDLVFDAIANLARSEKLSVYDAAYLELAMREDIPLATLDNELRAVAGQMGVDLAE